MSNKPEMSDQEKIREACRVISHTLRGVVRSTLDKPMSPVPPTPVTLCGEANIASKGLPRRIAIGEFGDEAKRWLKGAVELFRNTCRDVNGMAADGMLPHYSIDVSYSLETREIIAFGIFMVVRQ